PISPIAPYTTLSRSEGSRAAQGARRARHLYSVGNATAGLFAGDALELRIRVLPGASVAVTTPAASYAFTMPEGEASVRTRIEVEDRKSTRLNSSHVK